MCTQMNKPIYKLAVQNWVGKVNQKILKIKPNQNRLTINIVVYPVTTE